jgi:hypothetical protein
LDTGKIQYGRSAAIVRAFLFLGLFTAFTLSRANAANSVELIAKADVWCTSKGQLCEPSYPLEIEADELLQVQYTVPPEHCSSVRLHIFVDGALKVTTGFLGWIGAPPPFDALPLDTGLIDLGPVSSGKHLLSVQAEGQEGGCNPPRPIEQPDIKLERWAGTLHVFTGSRPHIALGSSLVRMSATKGKVICRNLTTKQRKVIKIRSAGGARSWDCEKAGLVVNSGDQVQVMAIAKGRAD